MIESVGASIPKRGSGDCLVVVTVPVNFRVVAAEAEFTLLR